MLSKELVRGITARCSEESYKKIEYGIIHFIPANAKRTLKGRIEFNREKAKKRWNCYLAVLGILSERNAGDFTRA